MMIKSQTLIRVSAWRVFESIANPAEKTKWVKGMIDSTFCFNEAKALNGHPVIFKEIMKSGSSFYVQQVQLISFRQGSHVELKYVLKNYSVYKNYIVRSIGNYSLLQLTFNVYYDGKRLQKIFASLFNKGSMKRNLENELLAIKNTLDYDFVQVTA
jgi:hypothetical protein